MGIGDVISMTLAILGQIEVRGKHNMTAMCNAMDNLEALQKALDAAKKGGGKNDGDDQQGQDV